MNQGSLFHKNLLLVIGAFVMIGMFGFLFWNQIKLQQLVEKQTGMRTSEQKSQDVVRSVQGSGVVLRVISSSQAGSITHKLTWGMDAVITKVRVSSASSTVPEAAAKLIFAIASDRTPLSKEWVIGTLPEGFRVVEGALTAQFQANTYYRVEVFGKDIKGNTIQDTTYFIFQ